MQINQFFQGKIKFGDKNTSECLFKYVDPCQMLSSLLSRTGLLGGIMSLSYTLYSPTLSRMKRVGKIYIYLCFPGGSDGKEYACNVGIMSLIPGSGRSPGRESTAAQSSVLSWRIPMDRGPWLAIVYGVAKSGTWLSNQACMHFPYILPHF